LSRRLPIDKGYAMKVVIAHSAAPGSQRMGGTVRYVLGLLKYLSSRGVEVTLLGIRYIEQEFSKPDYSFVPVLTGPSSRLEKGLWFKYDTRLALKIRALRIPDSTIIQTGRLDTMLPFVLLYPKNPKVMISDEPLIGWARPRLGRFFPLFAAFYHILEVYCLQRIDFLVTDERTEDYFLKRYPWLATKLRMMTHSGFDLELFRPADRDSTRQHLGLDIRDQVIIFVGRIEPVKNLSLLIRAFAVVANALPQATLIVVGRGSEETELRRQVQSSHVENKVLFAGEIPHRDIPKWMNCADVLALTSIREGSPTVVKESLACGVPVVSTDVGDVQTILANDLVGRVVPADDRALAQALIEVMEMAAEKPNEVREACVAAAQPYSMEAFGERMTKVYEEALARKGYKA